MHKALFLDRDGVINYDYGHVGKKEDFKFIPGIFDLVKKANNKDWLVIVITNQAGIAKGYYSEKEFLELNYWMIQEFLKNGAFIHETFYCPHHPDYSVTCECRKPAPGLIYKASQKFNINLKESILIGDKNTDIEAAKNSKIGKYYLFTEETHINTTLKRLRFD
ncbi:HAD family hydrolase [Comamonas aquatica]|uniref:D-glycero-alpha-D-manno-heptose-1,7-bisphosphate 7-phosphatase n=1 Tax=Comamonas aquatica TaxID=225991 RepID=UPI0024474E4A|nr:HAD family hydrolase [Comamonas aquatica]MDH0898974.1 HAD family hydrolase [Comamonas aquatica]